MSAVQIDSLRRLLTASSFGICPRFAGYVLLAISLAIVYSTPTARGQSTITADANTLLLDHFDGNTVANKSVGVTYQQSVSATLNEAADFVTGTWARYQIQTSQLDKQGTIEFWYNPHSYKPASIFLVNWYTSDSSQTGGGYIFFVELLSSGKIRLRSGAGPCESEVVSKSTVPLNTWTHIAVSWGSLSKIYLNGVVDATSSICFEPNMNDGPLYVNSWGNDDSGLIDELHVSNIQRTDDEIKGHASVAAPCSNGLSITAITPIAGGNTGSVTARINGCGVESDAIVEVIGGEHDIIGSDTVVLSNSFLSSTFNLSGELPGTRSIKVINPDGTSYTLANSFTIKQGGTSQVWARMVGRTVIRANTAQTFYISYGNSGGTDALAGHILVYFPRDVAPVLNLGNSSGSVSAETLGDLIIFTINVGRIPAGSTSLIPISLTSPLSHSPFRVRVYISGK